MTTRASHTPRPRGAGQGNSLTRTTWLHLLHLGGRAQRPLPVYQAIKAQAPDTTRAHTATMLARMAAAGQVNRHTNPAAGRPQYSYSVCPACLVPYGLSLAQILAAAGAALPAPTPAPAPAPEPAAPPPAPPPSAAQVEAALGADTVRRIREEFNHPYRGRGH